MIRQYLIDGEISHRLVLNHIVILYNVFGQSAYQLLLYKIEPEYYPVLFPFLNSLDRLPLPESMCNIEFDIKIVEQLESL
jgi:hypothetical protein